MKGTIIIRIKITYKMVHRNEINFLNYIKWERNINDGKRVPESGESKKYGLRVVLLLETLWQSFVPKDLVFEVEKKINSVISKLQCIIGGIK